MYMWTESVISNVRLSAWQLTLARNVRRIFGFKQNPNPNNFRGCAFLAIRDSGHMRTSSSQHVCDVKKALTMSANLLGGIGSRDRMCFG